MAASDVSLLYIHGFNSSPLSAKAQRMRKYFVDHGAGDRILMPALPPAPRQAMSILENAIAGAGPVALVGSSLGGFYATWLAQHHELRAVLINPAVSPWNLLDQVPEQMANYHTGERYRFDKAWLDDLRHYGIDEIAHPENLLALVQTGDETLDWHDAWDYYADSHLYRGLGGSHSFDDFDAFIPLVLRFCGITFESPSND